MSGLFIDCPTGIAGDMLLGAFLDIGVPRKIIESPLALLGLGDAFRLNVQESRSFGLRGLKVCVSGLEASPPRRTWAEIRRLVIEAPIEDQLRERVLGVFLSIAEAEALVHGTPIKDVHFHELGAIDALVDIFGVCAAVEYLKPSLIYCSPLPIGSGTVSTSHGTLPVPVPAILELAKRKQIKLVGGQEYPKGELTTPTGMALMGVLADEFGQPACLGIDAVGVGLGDRNLGRPNLLRVCEFNDLSYQSPAQEITCLKWESIISQETWIDDSTAEDIATLVDDLRAAGAIDVISHPVQMKKGRQGVCLRALVVPEKASALRLVWFSKGTSLGLREREEGRWILPRRSGFCHTSLGKVRVKQFRRPNGKLIIKPEHQELRRLSIELGKHLDEVRNEVLISLDEFCPEEDWD